MAMAAVAVGMSAMSAMQKIQQGKAQAAGLIGQAQGFEAQAKFTRFQGKQESLKHKAVAVNKLSEILEHMATNNNRAGSGNIDPFSGSPERLQIQGIDRGGMDLLMIEDNREMAILTADFQASQFEFQADRARSAASTAKKLARTGALVAFGTSMATFYAGGAFSGGGAAGAGAGASAGGGGSSMGLGGGGWGGWGQSGGVSYNGGAWGG